MLEVLHEFKTTCGGLLLEIVIETIKLIFTRSSCAIFFYQPRIHEYIITGADILACRNLKKRIFEIL